jgi:tetratricopeptide (TPR) repeat protein
MKTKAELIEGKVMARLLEPEDAEFNRLLTSDKSFAREFQIVTHLSIYMKNEPLFQFRETLQEIGAQYRREQESKGIIYLKQYWKQIASIAAIALIFVGSYWYINQMSSTDALFEQYYETDEIYLNTRSGNTTPTDLLEQGLLLFENDQYMESIDYFDQLPTSITAIYYSGVAHMEIGEYEVAKFKFDQVISNYVNVFYDQANWYKGLCLLKQDQSEEAKMIFNAIAKSDSYYKNQAKELMNKLK